MRQDGPRRFRILARYFLSSSVISMLAATVAAACEIYLISLFIFAPNASATGTTNDFQSFKTFRDCDFCTEMIVLPSGEFSMGASKEEFKEKGQYQFMYLNETPRHNVYVKSFALAKFSITRRQFEIFARETRFEGKGCRIFNGTEWLFDTKADWKNPGFPQTPNDPVVCVSWHDAHKFLNWLNSKVESITHAKYRLPRESEWEYAARAGTITATYWGDNPMNQCKYENTRDLTAKILDPEAPIAYCRDGYVESAPVGSFKPNQWGLFDMLGNAEQWIEDCSSFGYGGPPNDDPTKEGDAPCRDRTVRGASWASIPIAVRAAMRNGIPPDSRNSTLGFRLAVDRTN